MRHGQLYRPVTSTHAINSAKRKRGARACGALDIRPRTMPPKKGGESESAREVLTAVVLADSFTKTFRPISLERPKVGVAGLIFPGFCRISMSLAFVSFTKSGNH